MPHPLIDQESAEQVEKSVRRTIQKSDVSNLVTTVVLLIIVLAAVSGIVLLSLKISRTSRIASSNAGGTGGQKPEIVRPTPTAPLPLPGGSGPGSAPPPAPGFGSGNPSGPVPENMVLVGGGEFIKGYDSKGQPVRFSLPPFYIDQHEITNREYLVFIKATGRRPPSDPRGVSFNIWKNGTFAPELEDHPVVNVSFADAEAYAAWAGKRLPNENEWEKAARGVQGYIYPWGNNFNPELANCAENPRYGTGTGPVGSFNSGRSPYGVLDMAGNVKEWTTTSVSSRNSRWKVVKGGSFRDRAGQLETISSQRGILAAPDL